MRAEDQHKKGRDEQREAQSGNALGDRTHHDECQNEDEER